MPEIHHFSAREIVNAYEHTKSVSNQFSRLFWKVEGTALACVSISVTAHL
jgi:hypothetical protein